MPAVHTVKLFVCFAEWTLRVRTHWANAKATKLKSYWIFLQCNKCCSDLNTETMSFCLVKNSVEISADVVTITLDFIWYKEYQVTAVSTSARYPPDPLRFCFSVNLRSLLLRVKRPLRSIPTEWTWKRKGSNGWIVLIFFFGNWNTLILYFYGTQSKVTVTTYAQIQKGFLHSFKWHLYLHFNVNNIYCIEEIPSCASTLSLSRLHSFNPYHATLTGAKL